VLGVLEPLLALGEMLLEGLGDVPALPGGPTQLVGPVPGGLKRNQRVGAQAAVRPLAAAAASAKSGYCGGATEHELRASW